MPSTFTQVSHMAIAKNEGVPMFMRIYFALFANATPHGIVNATQEEIAELVGTSQQCVSKHMKAMERAELILHEKRNTRRNKSKLVWKLDMAYGWKCRLKERNEKVANTRTAMIAQMKIKKAANSRTKA